LLFLLTLASGVGLSRSGRPLNTWIVTVRKLIALAAAILTALAVDRLLSQARVEAVTLALIIVAGLGVLSLFVSGVLLSRKKPVDSAILTLHKVAPCVAAIGVAAAAYLL
jgi:hypothetical protein